MKKIVRKFIYIAGVILLFLFNLVPIYAETGPQGSVGPMSQVGPVEPVGSDVSSIGPQGPVGRQTDTTVTANSETGPNSINQNEMSNNSSSNIQSENNQQQNNTANLDLNTGKNNVKSNTGVGNITTGNANGSVNVINVSNSEFNPGSSIGAATIDGSTGGDVVIPESTNGSRVTIPTHFTNNLTGPSSLNTTTLDNNNTLTFVDNSANSTLNDINIVANTGDNLIAKNTQVGEIVTGDINMNVNLVNLQNFINPNVILNLDLWSINNGLNGNLVIPELSNNFTGNNSVNSNDVNQNTQTNITNNSFNNIDNVFDYNTNTGQNIIDSNSYVGGTATGDTKISGTVSNIIDTPIYYIINVFGKWLGKAIGLDNSQYIVNEISGSNAVTGPDSINSNAVDSENTNNITTNDKNSISNKIKINANTGRNNIAENSFVDGVKTGSVNIISNIQNVIGTLSGRFGKIKIGIINIFGDWNGDLANEPIRKKPISLDTRNTLLPLANNPVQLTTANISHYQPINASHKNAEVSQINSIPELASVIISSENGLPAVMGTTQPENHQQGNPFPYMSLVIPGSVLAIWLALELLLRKLTK